jgi:hypothetical protein
MALEIDEGKLTDSTIIAADIKDGEVGEAEIAADAVKASELDVTDVSDDIAADIAEGELADSIIVTADIKDGEIIEPDINADSAPDDGDILTYDSTGTNFEWITPNAGTDITADLEEEVTEGSLADSVIVSADIKDGTVTCADLSFYQRGGFSAENITAADDKPWNGRMSVAVTIRAIHAVCTAGGANVTLGEFDANGANGVVCDDSWINCTATNANDDGTLSNPSIDAGDYVGLIVNNATEGTNITVTYEFTYD